MGSIWSLSSSTVGSSSPRPARSGLQEVAHASIDAGADIVIGHHPHVLQGFEWYDGKLIAYSLGNLVFDQDFLATYASTMLRVVYEGDRLIEAKVYPLSLEGYRPLPAADALAEDILRTIDARSATPAIARATGRWFRW